MKKIYLSLILALIFILGISVNAEEGYTPGANTYTDSMTDSAKTVIIYKGTAESDITSESLYYIDQCDEAEGFSNLEMLMKLDAPAGEYTVVVEGGATKKFTISKAEAFVSGATEPEFLGAEQKSDGSYSVAYGFKASLVLSDVSSLTMVMGDKAYSTDLFGKDSIIAWNNLEVYTDENGNIMFAIQIDGVDADYITTDEAGNITPEFSLYVK